VHGLVGQQQQDGCAYVAALRATAAAVRTAASPAEMAAATVAPATVAIGGIRVVPPAVASDAHVDWGVTVKVAVLIKMASDPGLVLVAVHG